MKVLHITDPWRSIGMASLLCLVLAVFVMLFALIALVAALVTSKSSALIPAAVYAGIGIFYLFLGTRINRRQAWAAITAICLTSTGLSIPLISLAMIFLDFVRSPAAETSVVILVVLLCFVLLIVALVLAALIYQLARALKAIRMLLEEERVGFEVVTR